MAAQIDKWLKDMEEKFEEQRARAEEEGDDDEFEKRKDGRYIGRLVGAEITDRPNSDDGEKQISWKLIFLEGEYRGETHYFWDGLGGEDSFYWVCKKLAKCGIDLAGFKPTKLAKTLAQIEADRPVIQFSLYTKPGKEYQNTYFRKYLPDWQGEDPTEEGEAGTVLIPEVGEEITFKDDDDEEQIGIVKTVDEEEQECTVKVGKKTHTVAFSSIVAPETEEDASEETAYVPEEDDEVTFTVKGKELEGMVISVDEDEETCSIKVGKKTYEDVPFSDIAVPVTVEAPEVGDEVTWTDDDDEEVTGTVTVVDDEEETFSAKVGKKTHKDIPFASIVADSEGEEDSAGDPAAADDPDTTGEPEIGMHVQWEEKQGRKTVNATGIITKINEDEDPVTCKIKRDDNKKVVTIEVSELETVDDEE